MLLLYSFDSYFAEDDPEFFESAYHTISPH